MADELEYALHCDGSADGVAQTFGLDPSWVDTWGCVTAPAADPQKCAELMELCTELKRKNPERLFVLICWELDPPRDAARPQRGELGERRSDPLTLGTGQDAPELPAPVDDDRPQSVVYLKIMEQPERCPICGHPEVKAFSAGEGEDAADIMECARCAFVAPLTDAGLSALQES